MIAVLCQDLERAGLDLDRVLERLRAQSGVEAHAMDGPCSAPERWLAPHAARHTGFVLGLCQPPVDRPALRVRLRRAGLDPSAIEIVGLRGGGERAEVLLAGAAARAAAFGGSRPENLRPVLHWQGELSRRSLFTVPPVQYDVIPSIRREDCVAANGCRVCATACPHDALRPGADGEMSLDRTRCTGCGACVSACPRTAIDLPGASPRQVSAQVAALLATAPGDGQPRAILFTCARAAAAAERLPDRADPCVWLPVEVPCAGMVTPAWLLQTLGMGAAAVGVLPCAREDCRFGRPDVVHEGVAYCREVLGRLGEPPERIRLLAATGAGTPGTPRSGVPALPAGRGDGPAGAPSPFRPAAAARALVALAAARAADAAPQAVAHPRSPFGVVEVARGCTACGACVHACPTGALSLERRPGRVALLFDPALCVGCGGCTPSCPERVMTVRKLTDVVRLARPPETVHEDGEARCQACGGPIASREMLRRIGALLGESRVTAAISRLCLGCRAASRPA